MNVDLTVYNSAYHAGYLSGCSFGVCISNFHVCGKIKLTQKSKHLYRFFFFFIKINTHTYKGDRNVRSIWLVKYKLKEKN